MNSHTSSVRPNPFHSSESLTSRIDSPKPVEAMLFMLPGIDKDESQKFRRWATAAGLVHYIRGNGVRALQRDEFSKPVPGGLKRNAHIFINGHGNDATQGHTMCIDEKNKISKKTSSLMRATRKILRAGIVTDTISGDKITLHMLGCHIGALRKQITPNQVQWASGTFLMYGGRKSSDSRDQLPCMAAAIHYLGLCKQNRDSYDPLGFFDAVASNRSHCISIAGDKLRSAVVAHAPHALRDIMQPQFQIDATADKNGIQHKCISGSAFALQQLSRIEANRLATTQGSIYSSDERIIRLLINCIERDDLINLIDILLGRLDLLEAKDDRGNSLLLMAIGYEKPDFIELLIKHSSMINQQGVCGITPLHVAAEKNDAATMNLLLTGNQRDMCAELDLEDDDGNTPLIYALAANAHTAVARLIDAGANVHLANHAGETPLMLAAELGDLEIV